jgi:nitrogen fixation NifU-like protein
VRPSEDRSPKEIAAGRHPDGGGTASTDLRELYQSVILDHNRAPRNYGEPAKADGRAEGSNPLCGDQVTVWVKLDGDRLSDVYFVGSGCAISRASASMMTAALKGRTVADAVALSERFQDRLLSPDAGQWTSDPALGKLAPLSGVSRYPMRVKCATLAWHAFRAALKSANAGSVPTIAEP